MAAMHYYVQISITHDRARAYPQYINQALTNYAKVLPIILFFYALSSAFYSTMTTKLNTAYYSNIMLMKRDRNTLIYKLIDSEMC